MRLTLWGILLSLVCIGLVSCTKKTQESQTAGAQTLASDHREMDSPTPSGGGLVPLPITLPKQIFESTIPSSKSNIAEADYDPRGRPHFLAPANVANVALNKPVTGSTVSPGRGELSQLVDGDKEATEDSLVDLGSTQQWVQIDLESPHELWAILFWHFHKEVNVYYDVIVRVADDPDFITNVRTLFNNDKDNSSGLAMGTDKSYRESYEGKLVNARQEVAQYVRLYSNGNVLNDRNHYLEVEVYGRPAK